MLLARVVTYLYFSTFVESVGQDKEAGFIPNGQHKKMRALMTQKMFPITGWEKCTVRYYWDSNVDERVYNLFVKVVSFIEDNTAVRFLYTRKEEYRTKVAFTTRPAVVNDNVRTYELNLYYYGRTEYSVFKQILRAMGFLPELLRRERDGFVVIIQENILQTPECEDYYNNSWVSSRKSLPFSMKSIMADHLSYCSKCPGFPVVRSRTTGNLDSYNIKYGFPHADNVTDKEYRFELSRIETLYPYFKCYKDTYGKQAYL